MGRMLYSCAVVFACISAVVLLFVVAFVVAVVPLAVLHDDGVVNLDTA